MNNKRKKLCLDYLNARSAFRKAADDDAVLQGNDNIMGRIGEAIAHSYLEQIGRNPKVEENQTNKGFDITCEDKATVSVKLISSENKSGGTTKIDADYDELILIKLNDQHKVDRLGHIKKVDFMNGYRASSIYKAKEPYFRESMLDDFGLISKYGTLFTGSEIERYKLL
ncbi:hypothetical protein F0365_07965 [Nonlabens sp. Ci31]|jgi:hypothetical protein|uniref:hypothetical protein n=1 Tax=Nonlabens sp. Ci31 TaxID=2608253 RepID=UPI0014641C8E|nr:hypothetical protein [Nonlabens sp. Ci31]QJP34336.1 hypothetical protein F0365_07965 [Nonlabens sp. Ci31]